MSECIVDSCREHVSKAGFRFCYDHWRAERDGEITACEDCGNWKDDSKPRCYDCYKAFTGKPSPARSERNVVSATQLAEGLGVSARKLNSIFAELGWMTKEPRGWIATPQGLRQGALQKEHPQSGQAYVAWPETMTTHSILRETVDAVLGLSDEVESQVQETPVRVVPAASMPAPIETDSGFRNAFPATHRTIDGHMVRSRAEMLIDNYLYMAQLIHAYERRVPIQEEMYCDFYLPEGKVYIEYWGIESNPRYLERKAKKQALYKQHGLNLLELEDADISNLDDALPRKLLRFNIQSK